MGARRRDTVELTYQTERRWGPKPSWRCVYCGRIARTVDHYVPLDLGGSNSTENLVPACRDCNSAKMDYHPADWMVAVGVPLDARWVLGRLAEAPFGGPVVWRPTRNTLNYAAGKALTRPRRMVKGV